MLKWIYLGLMICAAVPSWSQAAPSATEGTATSDDQQQMTAPPPVSDKAYPKETGSEAQSNYISGGVALETSYIDNMYPGSGASPIGEWTYSIRPTIAFDQTTERQHRLFSYSPGFTIYRPTSSLDETDQNATVAYQFRLTPHATVSANDSFQKSSASFVGGTISGSLPNTSPTIIAPFAQLLTNTADAQFSLQLSPSAMIGAAGTLMTLRYPNPAQAAGLYNSDQRGGSAFYNRRISGTQYVGANYQYSWIHSFPEHAQSTAQIESQTQTHAVYAFYTIYPMRNFSISASGGVQHYAVAETSSSEIGGWAPMFMGSMGWQVLRTSVSANYSREVSGGGGLEGISTSTSAAASVRRQVSRTWTAGVSANYSINKSVTPSLLFAAQQGHMVSEAATVEHIFSNHISLNFTYDHLHQSYGGIAAIFNNPDSGRETVSLRWQFTRPLGR